MNAYAKQLMLILCATLSFTINCMDEITCTTISDRTISEKRISQSKIAGTDKLILFPAYTLEIRDLHNGKFLSKLRNNLPISNFDVCGNKIITAAIGPNNLIKIWSFDGTCLYTLPSKADINAKMGCTSDEIIIFCKNEIEIWNANSGKLLKNFPHFQLAPCQVVVAGNKFITVTYSDIKIWDFNGVCLGTINHSTLYDKLIKVAGDKIIIIYDNDPVVEIRDLNNGLLLQTLVGHTKPIAKIEVAGDKIITQTFDQTIKIWKFDGTCLNTAKGRAKHFIPFIIVDKYIIITQDNKILIYNLNDQKLLHNLDNIDEVFSLASANGKIFATARSGLIKIWELKDGKHLLDLPSHLPDPQISIVDNILLMNSGTGQKIQLWTDLRPKQRLFALATALHPRCGESSSANVLYPHLLKEIGEFAFQGAWDVSNEPVKIREITVNTRKPDLFNIY